jgi:drug/metabolite transporter (DMT)-like permease
MKPMRGILLMLLAVSLFTVMISFIKAADRIPPGQSVFFRAGLSIPIILIWLSVRGQLAEGLRTSNWKGHVSRGLAGTTAMALGFAGLKFLPLPEVTALRFATPIAIVILAAIMLGERIRIVRVTAVIVGLLGVLIILFPRLGGESAEGELIGVALVLGSAFFAAFAQIFVKSMAGKEHTAAIVFYFSLTASGLALLTLPFGWVWPIGWEWVYLLGAGLFGGLGQILLTSSYRFADAGVLAPFTYVTMIWALIIGYFVFDEAPTIPMLTGAGLIIGSGALIVWRERQLGKKTVAEGKLKAKGMQ